MSVTPLFDRAPPPEPRPETPQPVQRAKGEGWAPTKDPRGDRIVWFLESVRPLESTERRGPHHRDVKHFVEWAERLRWSDEARERLRKAIAAAPRNGSVAINGRAAAIERGPARFAFVEAKPRP